MYKPISLYMLFHIADAMQIPPYHLLYFDESYLEILLKRRGMLWKTNQMQRIFKQSTAILPMMEKFLFLHTRFRIAAA